MHLELEGKTALVLGVIAVTFLASPRAGYITGSAIRIDGGLIASI